MIKKECLCNRSILPRTGDTYEASESRSFDSVIDPVKGSMCDRPRGAGTNQSLGSIDLPGGRGRHWASMDEREMVALRPIVDVNSHDSDLIDSYETKPTSHTSVSGKKNKFLMASCYIGFLIELPCKTRNIL
jgi:hypothetical protein